MKKKTKTVPFGKSLLGSIRPFLGQVQFFMLGAIIPVGSPWKKECPRPTIILMIIKIIFITPLF